ncbi:MAG TPA: hypothetical protein VIG49_15375 [Acetobacteraceae bacterium]|jgi:hypothetical protein
MPNLHTPARPSLYLLACLPLLLGGCVAAPLAQLALSQAEAGAAQPCPPAVATASATPVAAPAGTAGCMSAATTFAHGLGQALQQFTGSASIK